MKIIAQDIAIIIAVTLACLLIGLGCSSSNEMAVRQSVIKSPVPSINDSSLSFFKDSVLSFIKTKANGRDTLYSIKIVTSPSDSENQSKMLKEINGLKAKLKLSVYPDTVISVVSEYIPPPTIVRAISGKDAIRFIIFGMALTIGMSILVYALFEIIKSKIL